MPRTLWTALVVLSLPAAALAQESPTDQARRDLINRAEQARVAGDHTQALALGTRAGQVRMTPSLRLLIAQEHQALGHTLEALDHAERCAREAEADPTLRNRAAILEECTSLRARIAPEVSRLTVRVEQPPAGTRVFLDSHELVEPLWNVSIPVLPGAVVIAATTPDGRRFERTTHLARGASDVVAVTFPSLPPARLTDVRTRTTHAASSARGAGPWVVAGVGVLSFGTAAVLWALHDGAISDRDASCDGTGCDPSAVSYDTRARALTAATNVALAVGAAAAIGAGIWFVLGGRHSEAPASASTRAFVSPLNGGVVLGAEGNL